MNITALPTTADECGSQRAKKRPQITNSAIVCHVLRQIFMCGSWLSRSRQINCQRQEHSFFISPGRS